MVTDAGANTDAMPETMRESALMGKLFMEKVMGIENPRVGLINNGAEEKKGTELYRETYKLLKELDINFVGNVEGRDFPNDACDVLVTDGFTGNIVVKLTEGFGVFMKAQLKRMFYANVGTKNRCRYGERRAQETQARNGLLRVRRRTFPRYLETCHQSSRKRKCKEHCLLCGSGEELYKVGYYHRVCAHGERPRRL